MIYEDVWATPGDATLTCVGGYQDFTSRFTGFAIITWLSCRPYDMNLNFPYNGFSVIGRKQLSVQVRGLRTGHLGHCFTVRIVVCCVEAVFSFCYTDGISSHLSLFLVLEVNLRRGATISDNCTGNKLWSIRVSAGWVKLNVAS